MFSTKISVIVPTHNRLKFVLPCLDSIAKQSFSPHEVIVVDDGSSDGTVEALRDLDGIRLVTQENAGPGAARNRGALEATGEYLAFLDSDDLWFPWSLETMAILIDKYRPSLLFGAFKDFSGEPAADFDLTTRSSAAADFFATAGAGYFAGAGMIVTERNAFLKVCGFIEDRLNGEDHDLALKLGASEGFVKVHSPVTVAHRTHDGNAMGDAVANWEGILRLISSEKKGVYPGGNALRKSRRMIISGHVRPAIVALARSGGIADALKGYVSTFSWNLGSRSFKFLISFPVLLLRVLISLTIARIKRCI